MRETRADRWKNYEFVSTASSLGAEDGAGAGRRSPATEPGWARADRNSVRKVLQIMLEQLYMLMYEETASFL